MPLEVVVALGAVGLAVIVVWTVVAMWRGRAAEEVAREQWSDAVERGALPVSLHPKVDLDRCIGSGTCVTACPEVDVLAVIDGKARLVNPGVCVGHGECLRACPVDAIQLVIGHEKRGVDLPFVSKDYETNVPGLYVVGELGGMGLIYNAMTQALQCVAAIAKAPPPRADGVRQVAIVGAGPAGLAASLAALDAGLDFVTLDQETIGGTVLHYPRHKLVMTKGVRLPRYGTLHLGEVRKEQLLQTWEEIVAKTGLSVRTGTKVESVRKDGDVFEIATSTGPVRAQRVILAMGRRGSPRKLGVPGEETGKVVYRLQEPERYTGRRCLVVGGGDAGVEAAVALGEAGAEVVLAHRGKAFDRIKPKNQQRLDEAAGKGRVTILLGAVAKEIRHDCVVVDVLGEARELPNDDVLVFAGGELPTKFLEAAGVQVRTFKGETFAPANQ